MQEVASKRIKKTFLCSENQPWGCDNTQQIPLVSPLLSSLEEVRLPQQQQLLMYPPRQRNIYLSYLASFPYALSSCGFLGSSPSFGPASNHICAHTVSSQADALTENRHLCQDALGVSSLPQAAHRLDLSRLQQCLRQAWRENRGRWASEK